MRINRSINNLNKKKTFCQDSSKKFVGPDILQSQFYRYMYAHTSICSIFRN